MGYIIIMSDQNVPEQFQSSDMGTEVLKRNDSQHKVGKTHEIGLRIRTTQSDQSCYIPPQGSYILSLRLFSFLFQRKSEEEEWSAYPVKANLPLSMFPEGKFTRR
jgi:hypothetical protein